jgi:hypothetical protein
VKAIRDGRFFVGFDAIGDTTGFSFTCDCLEDLIFLSSESASVNDTKGVLRARAPNAARFILLKNGQAVYEVRDALDFTFPTKEAGTYRVEVYRDDLGPPFDMTPWIMSNPIYVR